MLKESPSESEDEDAEALTKSVELGFFKTLALLKSNNPVIYDKSTKFFDEEAEGEEQPARAKKEKPMYLKDFERNRLLTKGVNAFVSDEEDGIPLCAGSTSHQHRGAD